MLIQSGGLRLIITATNPKGKVFLILRRSYATILPSTYCVVGREEVEVGVKDKITIY